MIQLQQRCTEKYYTKTPVQFCKHAIMNCFTEGSGNKGERRKGRGRGRRRHKNKYETLSSEGGTKTVTF